VELKGGKGGSDINGEWKPNVAGLVVEEGTVKGGLIPSSRRGEEGLRGDGLAGPEKKDSSHRLEQKETSQDDV